MGRRDKKQKLDPIAALYAVIKSIEAVNSIYTGYQQNQKDIGKTQLNLMGERGGTFTPEELTKPGVQAGVAEKPGILKSIFTPEAARQQTAAIPGLISRSLGGTPTGAGTFNIPSRGELATKEHVSLLEKSLAPIIKQVQESAEANIRGEFNVKEMKGATKAEEIKSTTEPEANKAAAVTKATMGVETPELVKRQKAMIPGQLELKGGELEQQIAAAVKELELTREGKAKTAGAVTEATGTAETRVQKERLPALRGEQVATEGALTKARETAAAKVKLAYTLPQAHADAQAGLIKWEEGQRKEYGDKLSMEGVQTKKTFESLTAAVLKRKEDETAITLNAEKQLAKYKGEQDYDQKLQLLKQQLQLENLKSMDPKDRLNAFHLALNGRGYVDIDAKGIPKYSKLNKAQQEDTESIAKGWGVELSWQGDEKYAKPAVVGMTAQSTKKSAIPLSKQQVTPEEEKQLRALVGSGVINTPEDYDEVLTNMRNRNK